MLFNPIVTHIINATPADIERENWWLAIFAVAMLIGVMTCVLL